MENAITTFLDAIVPKLEDLLSDMRLWIGIAILIGPIILVCKGIFYAFLSPREANHRLGYRTYFGMGSVPAWKFTQRYAGIVWGATGLILGIVALISTSQLPEVPAEAMMHALNIVFVEGIGCLIAVAVIEITVLIRYDMNGSLRFRKLRKKKSRRQSRTVGSAAGTPAPSVRNASIRKLTKGSVATLPQSVKEPPNRQNTQ